MGIEIEFKYAALPQQLAALEAAFPGPWQTLTMGTTYYDTPDGALSARRWTLRRRLENGRGICTLKCPAPRGRGEWDTEAASVEAALPELCKLSGRGELAALAAGGLEAVCGARFIRRYLTLDLPQARVELALDRGSLLSGSREAPLCEVEVELKSGESAAAEAFAADLAARFGLTPEPGSKFRRALALREEHDHGA